MYIYVYITSYVITSYQQRPSHASSKHLLDHVYVAIHLLSIHQAVKTENNTLTRYNALCMLTVT